MYHHAEGIFLCERLFGTYIKNSNGREVPVRAIGEQHVMEDLGKIPTVQDWLSNMKPQPWMGRKTTLMAELEAAEQVPQELQEH